MKSLIIVFTILLLAGCATEKKVMDSWIGASKGELIRKFGPAAKTSSDGEGGEVLVWGQRLYNSFTGNSFYKYTMFYLNSNNKVYHWLIQRGAIPPERLDVRLFVN